ncbi:unnamed protein product [Heligmosomoides polygyrus]|uniref:Reverse transcriptase domain-containing protein n=1 Tax=Heligmosomoides polygyrus TaxID=6339 RepID=A0A183FZ43_HELPZ|nr:unnamed protein product [Heligmosomoides polygyrus]
MPDDWRNSTIVPTFKQKGDAFECSNYRGFKLISHTMKIYERLVDSRLREMGTRMTKNMDITVGVHQGSALSPFFFLLTLDSIVNHLEGGSLRTFLYADDIALVADSWKELEEKVQL